MYLSKLQNVFVWIVAESRVWAGVWMQPAQETPSGSSVTACCCCSSSSTMLHNLLLPTLSVQGCCKCASAKLLQRSMCKCKAAAAALVHAAAASCSRGSMQLTKKLLRFTQDFWRLWRITFQEYIMFGRFLCRELFHAKFTQHKGHLGVLTHFML